MPKVRRSGTFSEETMKLNEHNFNRRARKAQSPFPYTLLAVAGIVATAMAITFLLLRKKRQ